MADKINRLPKLPTIDIKGGKFVKVKTRLEFMIKNYPSMQIDTKMKHLQGNIYMCTAVVYPHGMVTEDQWVGHSAFDINESKGLEKGETVAIGRALGINGVGLINSTEIASADEMEKPDKDHKVIGSGVFPTQLAKIKDALVKKGITDSSDQQAVFQLLSGLEDSGGLTYGKANSLIKEIEKAEPDTLKNMATGSPF